MNYAPEYRKTRTNNVRFRLEKRWFKDPLLVLQLETADEKRTYDNWGHRWSSWSQIKTSWRDASLEDLSVMNIKDLSIGRDGGELPACFRPRKLFIGKWMLVLQTLNGAIKDNTWRDARIQDLLFKDGNFLGGVGLVSR